jgi:hypothetical protein
MDSIVERMDKETLKRKERKKERKKEEYNLQPKTVSIGATLSLSASLSIYVCIFV